MAITITQQPANSDVGNRRLMFACTSTNSGNTGFKFKIIVTTTQGTNTFWIPPNINGAAILDIAQLIKLNNQEIYSGASVHKLLTVQKETTGFGAIYDYTISVQESWLVAGVQTLQGTPTTNTYNMVWNGVLQASDPQTTDLATRYRLDSQFKRWLSDRKWNTHNWLYANLHNFSPSTDKTFIPVREQDWGVMSVAWYPNKSATKIRLIMYEDDGTPHTTDIDVSSQVAGEMYHFPLYPANLNAQTNGWEKPSTYPNWPFYSVQALNASNTPVSIRYIFYNVADKIPVECLFSPVRLAWKGFGGSWEYFNFTKRNEKSYNIERKQYRKVLGSYGTTYTMIGQERGLTETEIVSEQLITANSDWISENEFEFLTGLFTSRQVMIVNDNGTHTPVVVQDAGFTEKKARDGKLVNQTIQLKYSNNLWV